MLTIFQKYMKIYGKYMVEIKLHINIHILRNKKMPYQKLQHFNKNTQKKHSSTKSEREPRQVVRSNDFG